MDNSLFYLLLNAILYSVTLLCIYKSKGLSVGLLIWGLFTLASWMSFLLWQQPYFVGTVHDNPQNPFALLYLYGMLFLTICPLFSVSKLNYGQFSIKHDRVLFTIITFIIVYQFLAFFIDGAKITFILDSPDLSDLRDNVYDGSNSEITKIPFLNRINLIYSGLKPISVAFSVVLFFCYKKKKKLRTLFLFSCFLSIINEVVVMVSRGIMVSYIIYITIILFFIRDYISIKAKRVILLYCIPFAFIAFTFFWAISVSRFGDLANYMIYKYAGEAMINFGGILFDDIKGYTYGRGYLLLPIYRDYITCEEKWEFIESITKVRVSIFYTYIGELLVEFGHWGAVIAGFFITFIQKQIYSKPFTMASMFVLYFFVYAFSYGLFIFSIQGFQGFFFMLFTFLFYHYFKENYKKI